MLSFVILCYFSGIAIFVFFLFSLVVAYLYFFDDEKSGAKVELSAIRTPLFLVFLCCTTYFLTYIILGSTCICYANDSESLCIRCLSCTKTLDI